MCNAWNHPPGCTCGWGGVGHLGRRGPGESASSPSPSQSYFWWVPPIHPAYESYVNPNASCPVCGAPVFFYQSPYGGRVFFDELGPPWPKHPCTDNTSIPNQVRSTGNASSVTVSRPTYQWQLGGWQPFLVTSVRPIDRAVLEIHGTFGENNVCLYIAKIIEHSGTGDPISTKSIAHIRPSADGSFEISVVTNFGKVQTVIAFRMASEARPTQSVRRKQKQSIIRKSSLQTPSRQTTRKPIRSMKTKSGQQEQLSKRSLPNNGKPKNTSKKHMQNRNGKPSESDRRSPKPKSNQANRETTMSLAFAVARDKASRK